MPKTLTNRQIKTLIRQKAASHRLAADFDIRKIAATSDVNGKSRLMQIAAQHSLVKSAMDQLLEDIEDLEGQL